MTTKEKTYNYAIIIASDTRSSGENEDLCIGECKKIMPKNYNLVHSNIIADEIDTLKKELIKVCDIIKPALVFTSGGTGFSKRDVTPEATREVVERFTPGISEAIRLYSKEKTNRWMLSRAISGIRKDTLIINLPGSPKAVRESIEAILPSLSHGLDILLGYSGEH